MPKRNEYFCDPGDFSILIPYKDFVKMVQVVNNYDAIAKEMDGLRDQLGALRGLYSELLQKVGELERYI